MAKELGQQFIIEKCHGPRARSPSAKAARAAPDGYTIQIGHVGTKRATGTLTKKPDYDLLTDLLPIARLPQNPCWSWTLECGSRPRRSRTVVFFPWLGQYR